MFWIHRVVLFVHVVFAFLYMLSHGTSVAVSLRLRKETSVDRIRALLDVSWSTIGVGYQLLLVSLLAGIALGFMGHWWRSRWIWASIGILVVLVAFMVRVAARHFHAVRQAVGLPRIGERSDRPAAAPAPPDEVARVIAAGRPGLIILLGIVGLSAIVWMMLFKPA